MANLTRKQQAALMLILKDLLWTQQFVADNETRVARTCRPDDVTAYTPANKHAEAAGGIYDAPAIRTITKDIGSPLCGLPRAAKSLEQFILVNSPT